jgi:hypothetical protein
MLPICRAKVTDVHLRDISGNTAFRVQSPWWIKNPNGDNPNEEKISKPAMLQRLHMPVKPLRPTGVDRQFSVGG